MNFAQLNPSTRDFYKRIIKKNIADNPMYNLEQFPEIYRNPYPEMKIYERMQGGARLQQYADAGGDPHYPSIEQMESNDSGGAYNRTRDSHLIRGGLRRPRDNSIGILKKSSMQNRVPSGLVNEIDMDYIPEGDYHGAGMMDRRPRLTNAIKQKILMMHPELQAIHMQGGKINFKKIFDQMKKGLSFASKAAPIVSSLAPEEYKDSINKFGDISGKISTIGSGSCGGKIDKQFFKDFGQGFKQGFKGANKIASKVLPIASIFQPELMPLALASSAANSAMGGKRKKATLPKSGKKRNTARGDIVSAIMRQRGVSLGEASRIVKNENLY